MTSTPQAADDLSKRDLEEIFYFMTLARAAEERLELLSKQGHLSGSVYRSLGQEAVSVGAAYALDRRDDGTGDLIAQTVRTAGALFLFGGSPLDYIRQYLARATAPTGGKESNVHWVDYQRGLLGPVSPLGIMVEVMSGVTLAFKLRGQQQVGMVFGGDGQTSTGAWHEGMNFAAVQRCPLVIVVQANQWAFSTPTHKQTRVQSFVEKAPGYGVAGESVDGNDVLEVYRAARRAVERCRAGEGVTLLEARTYRRKGHAQHDGQEYVPSEELREWEAKDPISRFRQYLTEAGLATNQELDELTEKAFEEARIAGDTAVSEPLPEGPEARMEVYTDADAAIPWTRTGEVVRSHGG